MVPYLQLSVESWQLRKGPFQNGSMVCYARLAPAAGNIAAGMEQAAAAERRKGYMTTKNFLVCLSRPKATNVSAH